ncbi:MAG: DVUA0089 family protein [Myxococcaceae bacterium]
MNPFHRRILAAAAALTLSGCSAAATDEGDVETAEQSIDSFANPTWGGELQLGEDAMATFTDDARYHAFDFAIPAPGNVRLYTLPADSGAQIDTVLYLYRATSSGYSRVTQDDDARGTRWSEITRNLTPGSYRIIVKAMNALTRGTVRIGFDCPQCIQNDACVFGDTFLNVRRGLTVKVDMERTVDHETQLSAVEQAQLVDAMHESTHTDVTTAADAIARVDGNEVNVLHLWDATNARAYIAFEYGAGDSAYGRIYEPGSTTAVAGIHDSEIVGCNLPKGPLGRDCSTDATCGANAQCTGIAAGVGKCVSNAMPDGAGASCTSEWSGQCAPGGLTCAGLTRGETGLCQPAWMTGRFSDWRGSSIPDNAPNGAKRTLVAYGLASVDMDVHLDAIIRHAAVEQLKVTLENPAGAQVLVYDGTTKGKDLVLNLDVRGFSGDEQVNGTWTLKVVDTRKGTTGSIERWALTIGSRLD